MTDETKKVTPNTTATASTQGKVEPKAAEPKKN